MIDTLISLNSVVYFDIANKKYKVIMNMVEYCVYPCYMCQNMNVITQSRKYRINDAIDLYNQIKKEDFKRFIDLCQDTRDGKDITKSFLEFLYNLRRLFAESKSKEDVKIQNNITEVISIIEDKKCL
ncbi:MAG: hypothetical protein HFG79_10730 [Lachnospiraceae bacterium]|nr:hypothetical protein [Lachnospiraceae bacterium]